MKEQLTSQQAQTPSTSRRKRNRKHGRSSGSAHSFMKGKGSSIPLPTQMEDKTKKIVSWGGNNLFPYYLNYLFKNNPIHAGIVRSKQYYTTSGGLVYEGADVDKYNVFFLNGKSNPNEQNLQEVVEDFSLDLEKSNMYVCRILMTKVGIRQYRKAVPIPFERVRFEIEEVDSKVILTGRIKVSADWSDERSEIEYISQYKPEDPEQREFYVLYMEKSSQSLDASNSKKPNPSIYPDPPYGGGIVSIDTGIKINKHGNSELDNGFSLGTILNLNNGRPSNDDDKKKLEQDIADASTGVDNTGGALVLYGNGKDREASVTSLNGNDLPERYLNVKKSSEESIIHSHSVVTPTLFGIMQEGSFNADQLEQGYAIMQGNYFTSRRKAILSVVNWLGKTFFGLTGEIKFIPVVLQLEQQVTDADSQTLTAINNLSPLVATKLIESMTANEIRKLGKLPPIEGGDVIAPPTATTFSKEDSDIILERLKKHGQSKDKYHILHSVSLTDSSQAYEMNLMTEFVKSISTKLSDKANQALNLINQGEGFNSIRTALDISGTELAGIYKKLQELKMISIEGKVLAKGVEQLVSSDIEAMEILYEYRLRPNAPELVKGGESRAFCKELINLDRLYTRDEISSISGAEGYDVFNYRGGWYHNPDTNVNQPMCRHEWNQVIVFNK